MVKDELNTYNRNIPVESNLLLVSWFVVGQVYGEEKNFYVTLTKFLSLFFILLKKILLFFQVTNTVKLSDKLGVH